MAFLTYLIFSMIWCFFHFIKWRWDFHAVLKITLFWHVPDKNSLKLILWQFRRFKDAPGTSPPTSPRRPLKILFDHPEDATMWRPVEFLIWPPGDVLNWRPGEVLIWRSSDVPGRLFRDFVRTFSGRPLEDLKSTQTWMSKIFFNFSFRNYSIDQI